jgi:hypothetical protein
MPDDYPLPSGDPASLGFAATPLQHLDRLIRQHIEENRYPGAQIALARHGKLALFRSYGNAKTDRETAPATGETLFLLFSQTKVLTSAAVWTLIEEGKLSFMDRIADHLPEFAQRGKAEITLHQVMTHQGGFPSGDVTKATWTDHSRMRAEVCDPGHAAAIPPARGASDPGDGHRGGHRSGLSRGDPREGIGALGFGRRDLCRSAGKGAGALRRYLCGGAARQLGRVQGRRDAERRRLCDGSRHGGLLSDAARPRAARECAAVVAAAGFLCHA